MVFGCSFLTPRAALFTNILSWFSDPDVVGSVALASVALPSALSVITTSSHPSAGVGTLVRRDSVRHVPGASIGWC